MDTAAFAAALEADGYGEIETKTVQPNVATSVHAHPFAVRFLVLSGEIGVGVNGAMQTSRAGDVFDLQAGCEHVEKFGPEGCVYLVGRKHPR